jgi:DNA-binding beta-propeller fold protein YncE
VRVFSGGLSRPAAVAVAPGGQVLVADTGNDRIVRFDPDGHVVGTLGADGGPGRLHSPSGVAVDPYGRVWVTDTGADRIVSFAPDGSPDATFGNTGTATGQFERPWGIAVDCRGRIIVSDRSSNRVQRFTLSSPAASPCRAVPARPPTIAVGLERRTGLATQGTVLVLRTDLECRARISVVATPVGGGPTVRVAAVSHELVPGRDNRVRLVLDRGDLAALRRHAPHRSALRMRVTIRAVTPGAATRSTTRRIFDVSR